MKLKKGITGFFNIKDTESLPSVDFREFKREIIGIALMEGFTPIRQVKANTSSNFHYVGLGKQNEVVFVVCNSVYPYICFAKEVIDNTKLTFIWCQQLHDLICKYTQFEVLTPEVLNSKPSSDELEQLNKTELSQIKYWKPTTLGEIIYNWWD